MRGDETTGLRSAAPLALAVLLAVCAFAGPANGEETRDSGTTSAATSTPVTPDYVLALERAYGAASEATFLVFLMD